MLGLVVVGGCAAPEPPLIVWSAAPGAVHCYRTIAAPDCITQPVPGAERRLIASGPHFDWTWKIQPEPDG